MPILAEQNGVAPAMEITRTTVPGVGSVHHCTTRSGAHFGVLVDRSGDRQLFLYRSSAADESAVSGEPLVTIALENDEADHLANILHSRPIPDRMAELERRFAQIAENTR
jgi:TrkA domain protein